MRDLKYLYEFENYLQEANNDLVRRAKSEGRLALGYTCYHVPEVLLNCGPCFSVRLRAPRTGSLDIAMNDKCAAGIQPSWRLPSVASSWT